MSEDCPHCVFEKTEANCRGCFEGSHYKPKPITNADRIRAMTDEELADFLDRFEMGDVDYSKTFCNLCDGKMDCHDDCLMGWLKQEVADD